MARGQVLDRVEHPLRGRPHVIDARNYGLIAGIELEPILGKPGARAFENSRQQVIVARPPDQMRTQRNRGQSGAVGGEHLALGDRLGRRIVGLEVIGIGRRLVDARDRVTAMHDARRARVDQLGHALRHAGRDHVARAEHVGRKEALVGPPHLDQRGDDPGEVVVDERVAERRELAARLGKGRHPVAVPR